MQKTKFAKLVIIIPCFNEEKTLPKVIGTIPKKIPGIRAIEIIVIDDGSTDKTLSVARRCRVDHIVRHTQNKGLGSAFRTGIDTALRLGADYIVTIDGDGQFDPTQIPSLLKPLFLGQADMVTGSRFFTKERIPNMSYLRLVGNKLFIWLINTLTNESFTDTQCGLRAYSRETALHLTLSGEFTYTQEVFLNLIDQNMVIQEIPIRVKYYPKRKSAISGSLWIYGKRSVGIIIRATRDIQPLKFFGIPAVCTLLTGLALGTFMFIRYIILHETSPFKSLLDVSIALVIIGILVMFLALIADMQRRFRHNQEEILYRLRKQQYAKT